MYQYRGKINIILYVHKTHINLFRATYTTDDILSQIGYSISRMQNLESLLLNLEKYKLMEFNYLIFFGIVAKK